MGTLSSITEVKILLAELERHPCYHNMDVVRKIRLMQAANILTQKKKLSMADELKIVFKFIEPVHFFNKLYSDVYKSDFITVIKAEPINHSYRMYIMLDYKNKAKLNVYKLKEPERYRHMVKIFQSGGMKYTDIVLPVFKYNNEG